MKTHRLITLVTLSAAGLSVHAAPASLGPWLNLCVAPRLDYWNSLCGKTEEGRDAASAQVASVGLEHWRNLCGISRGGYWDSLCREEPGAGTPRLAHGIMPVETR